MLQLKIVRKGKQKFLHQENVYVRKRKKRVSRLRDNESKNDLLRLKRNHLLCGFMEFINELQILNFGSFHWHAMNKHNFS